MHVAFSTTHRRSGLSPLHCAVSFGYKAAIRYFLSEGININSKSSTGATPLHFAVKYGEPYIMEYLIQAGANVAAQDFNSETPLHFAIKYKQLQLMQHLIQNGANIPGGTPLHAALDYQKRRVEEFVQNHSSYLHTTDLPRDPHFLNPKNPWRRRREHHRLQVESFIRNHGQSKTIKYLIETGSDIEAQNDRGETPLITLSDREILALWRCSLIGARMLGLKFHIHMILSFTLLYEAISHSRFMVTFAVSM
jgi:ankyrin repeat protein